MRTLHLSLSLLVLLAVPRGAVAEGREAAPELPVCSADGATETVAEVLYTCGVCDAPDGKPFSVWAPGKHDAAAMEGVCQGTTRALANIAPQSIRIKVVAPPERKY